MAASQKGVMTTRDLAVKSIDQSGKVKELPSPGTKKPKRRKR